MLSSIGWSVGVVLLPFLTLAGNGCVSTCCRPAGTAPSSGRSESVRRVSESNDRFEIEVAYPRSRVAFIDSAVGMFVDRQVQEFIRAAESNPIVPWQSTMILTCTTTTSAGLLCYKFDNYVYTGGAHGNTAVWTFVFDRTWARQLSSDDIFRDGPRTWQTVSDHVIPQLKVSLGDMASESQIAAGAGPSEVNFADFIMSADSIIFFFEHYRVAPYAAGQQRVSVARSKLQPVLRPAFRDASGPQEAVSGHRAQSSAQTSGSQ